MTNIELCITTLKPEEEELVITFPKERSGEFKIHIKYTGKIKSRRR